MVNNKSRKRITAVRNNVQRTKVRMGPANSAKDAYKRLLLDPCNAPLTPSPYGDESGAVVSRAHWLRDNTFETMVLFWHPAYGLFENASAAGIAGSLVPINNTQADGSGRALAGCVEAMWVGAESARAGIVQCGIVPGAIVWKYMAAVNGGGGFTIDAAVSAAYIQNAERTPVDKCAINWFPSLGDETFTPPLVFNAANTAAIETQFAKTHFTVIFIRNVAALNMRFSFVTITEQVGLSNSSVTQGLSAAVWTVNPKTGPAVDVTTVVRELTSVDPAWYLNTFRKVARFGLGLVSSAATAGLPGALGYLTRMIAGGNEFGGKNGEFIRSGR